MSVCVSVHLGMHTPHAHMHAIGRTHACTTARGHAALAWRNGGRGAAIRPSRPHASAQAVGPRRGAAAVIRCRCRIVRSRAPGRQQARAARCCPALGTGAAQSAATAAAAAATALAVAARATAQQSARSRV